MMNRMREDDLENPLILVVDDNAANLGVVAMGLNGRAYRVLVAEDGEKAIDRATRLLPDLILLDVMMPDIDGFEVCRRLKNDPSTSTIPVIFMTALDDTKDKLTAFNAGGVDYVTKPLQIEEVIARIDTQLELANMRKRLEAQNTELAEHRDNLEQLVAGRTLELEKLNQQLLKEINERRKAQEELAAHEREYRTLAENAPDNIARADLDYSCRYINPSLEATLGVKAEDVIGQKLVEAFPEVPDVEQFQAAMESVISNGQPAELELLVPDQDNRVRYHNLRLVAEHDQLGNITGVLSIGRDITDLKATERRLEESNAQLKAMARRRESAREEERKHIARELHDELGQYLTALNLQTSALNIEFSELNPAIRTRLEQIQSLIDRTKKVTRNLSQKLRPLELDMGIDSALNTLVEQFEQQYGVVCDLEQDETVGQLSDNLVIILYRVVQESLTNIARHADATEVSVKLHCRNNSVILEVNDDGKGFDPTQVKSTSFGLMGMRERLQAEGGELEISSGPGHGTRIFAYLPTEAHSED